jgi:uncharacterized protein YuzE
MFKKIEAIYDDEYDILYIIIGKPTACDSEWLEDGVYLRKSFATGRLRGVIIEDYSKKDRDHLAKILPDNLGICLPVL